MDIPQPRIVVRHSLVQKQLHPFPVHRLVGGFAPSGEDLSDPGRLEREVQPHRREARRLAPKNGAGAKRTDHLIIAGKNQPEIPFPRGAVTSDFPDSVRIDSRHRRIDHLHGVVWMTCLEESFELPGEPVSRLGITHRGRLAQNKNPYDTRRFLRCQRERPRGASDLRGEEPPTEFRIIRSASGARPPSSRGKMWSDSRTRRTAALTPPHPQAPAERPGPEPETIGVQRAKLGARTQSVFGRFRRQVFRKESAPICSAWISRRVRFGGVSHPVLRGLKPGIVDHAAQTMPRGQWVSSRYSAWRNEPARKPGRQPFRPRWRRYLLWRLCCLSLPWRHT